LIRAAGHVPGAPRSFHDGSSAAVTGLLAGPLDGFSSLCPRCGSAWATNANEIDRASASPTVQGRMAGLLEVPGSPWPGRPPPRTSTLYPARDRFNGAFLRPGRDTSAPPGAGSHDPQPPRLVVRKQA